MDARALDRAMGCGGESSSRALGVPAFENAIGVEKRSVEDITPEAFERDYVSRCIPMVLTDVTASWPCARKWSLRYFAEAHGDVEAVADDGTPQKLRCPLREYVARLDELADAAEASGTAPAYLRTWNFYDDVPELLDDFPADSPYFRDFFKALKPSWQPPFTWLFLGPRGARTRLHVDVWHTDAWLTMIEGSKKFVMYHPAHAKHVFDEDSNAFADLHDPDLVKFPNFHRAVPLEFVLRPGETVYIPRGWPHYAVGLDATVSLTVNFLSRANRRAAVDRAVAYANRRDACEHILGRTLRASDNVMKFCVHGGELNKSLAASIMGLDAEGLDARVKERKRERLRAEAAAEEEEEEGEEEGGGSE